MTARSPRGPFRGSFAALPTPFAAGPDDAGGVVDHAAFARLIDLQVAGGTEGLVVAGTTGEAPTLSRAERFELFECAVERAARRIPVVAGVGTNSTRETIELAAEARARGVDGLLVVTPYYNKPSRKGLLAHFASVAASTDLPVMLYNVPSRTGVDLEPDAVRALAGEHANIVAIKESTPCVQRARELIESSDLAVFCGEDGLMADFMSLGADGAVGVVTNLAPAQVAELLRCAVPVGEGVANEIRASALVETLTPLVRDLFIEANPVPLKAALGRMGLMNERVRSPLACLEEDHRLQLEATLRFAGLI